MSLKHDQVIFLTGATGFIGSRLVRKLSALNNLTLYLLVRLKNLKKINKLLKDWKPKALVKPIIGDLSLENLGINHQDLFLITKSSTIIYHLGALYDVNASRKEVWKNNVLGTANIINLARLAKKLKLFAYTSTAYVAGYRRGKIYEDKLITPQGWHNFYEESKFFAEQLVRKYLTKLPIIIFRPSQVIGDSQTGQTDKFDGPYKLVKIISQGKLLVYPGPCQAPLNLVPVDFVVKAILTIIGNPKNLGKTFHLCDPHPLKARKFIDLTCRLLAVRKPIFTLPENFWKLFFKLPFLENYLKIKSSIDFLNQNLVFDTTNTLEALRVKKVKIPKLESYLPKILSFWQQKQKSL